MTTNVYFDPVPRSNEWDPPDDDSWTADAVERAAREAAAERYAEHISADPADPACPPETIDQAVLFTREENDSAALDMHDVQQGMLGDCFLLAPLAALARFPEGQELLRKAIAENRNASGDVVSYTVTLHKPQEHWLGLAKTTFTDVKVTIDATFFCGHAVARPNGNLREVWPLVMEKAYAHYLGSHNALQYDGSTSHAMEVITGAPSQCIGLGRFAWGYSAERLQSDLTAGKIVTFGTRADIQYDKDAPNLVAHHAYVATGVVQIGGKPYVTLHNPWNAFQPRPVPYDRVRDWFAQVQVGAVP